MGRLIAEYDMEGMAEELERRWLGEGIERRSLRDLADEFNRELLRRAMSDAGVSPLEGEVNNLYRLLTDSDVSSGERTRARRSLESDDVDVDSLTRDFVSHQAIHTYLTKYRDVSQPSTDPEDKVEKDSETIRKMRNRLAAITTKTLENLSRTERISLGDFTVFVDVRVTCTDCNATYSVSDLLTRGGCECENA
ncbi:hypothetical protein VB773_00660 [Haloarculaceae archaeon H-GB2-1]|nr:hypothetical protein [Haloarculaceae archaeon H-GB11]MEA5406235.1 hypothetical protein [Haloarculaceae archaeon H-GB2-1]